MTTVFDLQARRAARTPDKADLYRMLTDAIDQFNADVTGWHFKILRAEHLLAAERKLHAMQQIVTELYGHVSPDKGAA